MRCLAVRIPSATTLPPLQPIPVAPVPQARNDHPRNVPTLRESAPHSTRSPRHEDTEIGEETLRPQMTPESGTCLRDPHQRDADRDLRSPSPTRQACWSRHQSTARLNGFRPRLALAPGAKSLGLVHMPQCPDHSTAIVHTNFYTVACIYNNACRMHTT